MPVYNISKIEGWYDDFTDCKNKFNNTYYQDYKNGYIKKTSDGITNKVRSKLDEHYEKIKKLYSSIDIYWKNLINDVKAADDVLAGTKKTGSLNSSACASVLNSMPKLTEYSVTLETRFASASATVGTQKNVQWIQDNITFEKVGATIATLGVGAAEGVVNLFEAAVDLCEITGAAISSVFTGAIDLVSLAASKITGDESIKTNYTEEMWEGTRTFVSQDISKSIFDEFYENTEMGTWMKENAIAFDSVRAIGGEVAEVVCVVALSTVTGGSAAVIYGTAKFAEHAEENWQDENVSTFDGLVKSGAQGAADGFFFSLGMKGDAAAKAAAEKAVKEGGKAALKKAGILGTKMLYEAGTSVVQDGTSIVVDSIFMNDTIVDSNGNTIVFNNYKDKLNYSYEQAGGKEGLMTSAGTAFILSGLSDFSDVYDIHVFDKIKGAKNVDTDNTLKRASKSADADVSALKKEYNNLLAYKNTDIDANKIGKSANDISKKLTLDDLKYEKNSKLKDGVNYLDSNVKKYVYQNTNKFAGLNDEIKTNGLYHFTNAADAILDSGYIKSSGLITSYGNPKTFFFNGVPTVGQIASNIDDIPLRATAVMVKPTDEILNSNKLKVRSKNDCAITFDGKFDLSDVDASKEYFCLFKENDELVYRKVSHAFYDAYPNTADGMMVSDFLSNKKNINAIKSDFYSEMAKQKGTTLGLKNNSLNNKTIYTNAEIEQFTKEYNDLLAKSKESWFINAKEANDNGWAWNLNEAKDADNMVKRMRELEGILIDNNSGKLLTNKTSDIKNPKSFKVIEEITGGAAADEQIKGQVDEILNSDINRVRNVETSLPKSNLTSTEKTNIWLEYNKLVDKVTDSGDFDNKLYLHSRGNFFEGADQFAKDIEKIMDFEKQLGVPQSSSAIPDTANPFKWSKDKLDIDKSINAERKPYYNYGGIASEDQFLGNQPYSRVKTIKKGNDFYINSKTFTVDDMKAVNKNSRFKKTTVYITDNMDPSAIFQQVKKPQNLVIRMGDFEYFSDGKGIRVSKWRQAAPSGSAKSSNIKNIVQGKPAVPDEPIKSLSAKSMNQTNFENEVERAAMKLVDDYNYLHSLKENGMVNELIRQGNKFDAHTGIELRKIDQALKNYGDRIIELQDLSFVDDVVMTSRQRNLYDAMNGSIEALNKQFGEKYGLDIGTRQVMAYANGEIGLECIPQEYRNVFKSYSNRELQESFLLKNEIDMLNDFAKNGKMTDNYTRFFSKYVDSNKIADTRNVNILLTDEAFRTFYPGSTAMAFNNGKNSYINLKYTEDVARANVSHENIHQMSSNGGISGVFIDENHRGMNEAITEYLNKTALNYDYPKKVYCGYQPMVSRLELLNQNGIFTNDEIMNAYFNNNISPLKNKVNQLAGSNDYFDKLVLAFKEAHDNHDCTNLDKCCSDLIRWKFR